MPDSDADPVLLDVRAGNGAIMACVVVLLTLVPLFVAGVLVPGALAERITLGVVAAVGIGLAGFVLLRTAVGVRVTASQVVVAGFLGRRRVITRARLRRGLFVATYVQFGVASPLLMLIDTEGRTVLRLSGAMFPGVPLTDIAAAIGRDRFDYYEVATPAELAADRPGLLWFGERHPWWLAILVTSTIIIVTTVAFTLARAT